jgi:hypothetical protein
MDYKMPLEFDENVGFDGSLLIGWANEDHKRIRCLAGRETIAELNGFTHASATEIRSRKHEAFNLLKDKFARKIRRREFDNSVIPSVTVFLSDMVPA